MRKVLTVALAFALVVSLTGVLAVGTQYTDSDVAQVYDDVDEVPDKLADELDKNDLEGVERLVVVAPEGIEEGKWVERATGTDKVMVWVDPIHVTE